MLAVMLADGGEAIADIAALADQPALHGPVASPATAWRVLAGIDSQRPDALRRARAAARERAWWARAEAIGVMLPSARAAGRDLDGVVIDIDVTLVEVHSDAEVAEVATPRSPPAPHTAPTARLIVRRSNGSTRKRLRDMVSCCRTTATTRSFTDSPFAMLQAESQHRGHAVIELAFADLVQGALAHLPSGSFSTNSAWLQLAAIAHTLTRAVGVLAGGRHAIARGATIRAHLIDVAAHPARKHRGEITWHLPTGWPHETAWINAFEATHRAPPARAA